MLLTYYTIYSFHFHTPLLTVPHSAHELGSVEVGTAHLLRTKILVSDSSKVSCLINYIHEHRKSTFSIYSERNILPLWKLKESESNTLKVLSFKLLIHIPIHVYLSSWRSKWSFAHLHGSLKHKGFDWLLAPPGHLLTNLDKLVLEYLQMDRQGTKLVFGFNN